MLKCVLNTTLAAKRDLIDDELYELLMNSEHARFRFCPFRPPWYISSWTLIPRSVPSVKENLLLLLI